MQLVFRYTIIARKRSGQYGHWRLGACAGVRRDGCTLGRGATSYSINSAYGTRASAIRAIYIHASHGVAVVKKVAKQGGFARRNVGHINVHTETTTGWALTI